MELTSLHCSNTYVAYTWVYNDTPLSTPPKFSFAKVFVFSESYFVGQG